MTATWANLSPEQITGVRQQVYSGVPKAKVARALGVSRQTLHEAVGGTGSYPELFDVGKQT